MTLKTMRTFYAPSGCNARRAGCRRPKVSPGAIHAMTRLGGWLVGRHFLDYRQGLFGIRIAADAADGRNDLAVGA
jgi:hypothetical protein